MPSVRSGPPLHDHMSITNFDGIVPYVNDAFVQTYPAVAKA
jgi:hypothetical protein